MADKSYNDRTSETPELKAAHGSNKHEHNKREHKHKRDEFNMHLAEDFDAIDEIEER